jgi:tetratricopeptide (TPR) repeat protein
MPKDVRKLSRKELLQEDQFTVRLRSFMGFLLTNKTVIVGVLGGALLLGLVLIGMKYQISHKGAGAAIAFGEANEAYTAPVATKEELEKQQWLKKVRTFPTENEKFQAAAESFEKVSSEFGSTDQGKLALYYAGNSYFELGEYEKAAGLFQKYLSKAGSDRGKSFIDLATEGLGYSYESLGKNDEAIAAFEKLITPERKTFRERGLFNSARLYAKSDNKAKALELYKALLTDYPSSRMARDVQQRVAELEAGA